VGAVVVVIARVVLVVLAGLIAFLTYPGALAVSVATALTPALPASAPPVGDLPWLHVAHPSGGAPYIADDQGRVVLLHGAIPASLIEFGPGTSPVYPIDPAAYAGGRCPANSRQSRYPPLCQADLQAMAALGFNSIRLPISWSVLEPDRGRFDDLYLDRVQQIVDWARAMRMYVIVDMHQNGYSHYIPAGPHVDLTYLSGAPRWATLTDGVPSQVYENQRELNPAVFEATTNFWYDRDGIQDEYIAAVAHVAKRFAGDSTVAGYGLYNEPWPGWNVSPGFEDLLLFPFYRRLVDALTGVHDGLPCWTGFFLPAVCGYRDLGVHDRQLMFLDTGLAREITDFPTHLGLPVSSYPNLVLALHAYTHIYTADSTILHQDLAHATYPWGGYDESYSLAEREARALGAALFVSEFGNGPGDDGVILRSQLGEQERHDTGFAFWTWKENGKPSDAWGVYDPASGCLRPSRESQLARVYPRATADLHASFAYDSSSGAFTMHAAGAGGDATTVVYVPPEVTGEVTWSGGVNVVAGDQADGSRVLYATPTGGRFTIAISPAPLHLLSCA
jgi:hypothetical protein